MLRWLLWESSFPPIAKLFAAGASEAEINTTSNNDVVPSLGTVGGFEVAKSSEPYGRPYL